MPILRLRNLADDGEAEAGATAGPVETAATCQRVLEVFLRYTGPSSALVLEVRCRLRQSTAPSPTNPAILPVVLAYLTLRGSIHMMYRPVLS